MGNEEADKKKFTWVIKEKSLLSHQNKNIYSDVFVIGGCKWLLMACPSRKGKAKHLSLFLQIANTLPCEWRRHTKYHLSVVNQLTKKLFQVGEAREHWFHQRDSGVYFPVKISKDNSFMMNGEAKVVVEIEVLEVIGELDVVVSNESEAVTVTKPPQKKIKLENGDSSTYLHKETSLANECIDVNGFQVLPSQVKSVKLIFERHPDIALEFRATNHFLRTACMNALLSLIETLCKPRLSYDDLVGTDSALTYVKDNGFKVDWLERKLEEVKEEKIGEIRMRKLEEKLKEFKHKCLDLEAQLKDSKQKCSEIEVLLEKEKIKQLAPITSPLKLDDIV